MRNFYRDLADNNVSTKLVSTRAVSRLFLVLAAAAFGGCGQIDRAFCPDGTCGWSQEEIASLSAMGDLPATAPPDQSNKYVGYPAAETLGRKFFWDARFSGVSSGTDALKRPMPYARSPKGQPLNIGCVTCHDLRRGGIDNATVPGNVSIGAVWTDTNTSTIFNDAFFPLILWGGRADSLWAQATGSIENSMGSTRLRAAWTVASLYRADYEAVFTEYPLPMTGSIADVAPLLETTAPLSGQCKLVGGACAAPCRQVRDDASGATACWPRFPLDGKPGNKMGCQPGDASEPFGDAYDCMAAADQVAITRVNVNYAKAVAAFEFRLISRNSAFDQFVADLQSGYGNESTLIAPEAKRGAKLFVGKAGCSDCHSGPLLSDKGFHNIGVPIVGQAIPTLSDCPKGGVCDCVTPVNCLPNGAFDGIPKMRKNPYRRESMWSDNPLDTSRKVYMDMPMESIPKGSYRTPSLRDVALTAPYMHTGAVATLEDVVAHYNRGGDPQVTGEVSSRLKPLYLTDQEQHELVAFLKTLTGEPLPAELADKPELPVGTP